jgi:predicted nucleotidyltransferase
MRQYDAVEIISNAILEENKTENFLEAIFLKGSLARNSEDQYSNIDLYCIIKDSKYDLFLEKELKILRKYEIIVYSKLIGNHLICVYENGIILNFYTLKENQLDYHDDMVVIYDPKGILDNYQKIPLEFEPNEIGELLDSFLLTSLEFYNSYKREDLLYSFNLASILFKDLGTLLRIKHDPEYAKLGLKNFSLDDDNASKSREKYLDIARKLKINSVLESVKMMYVLLDNYINNIPILLAEHINFDFYTYAKRKIMSIN